MFFAECGEIEAVRVVRNKEIGSGKGFGFVTFKVSVILFNSGKKWPNYIYTSSAISLFFKHILNLFYKYV